MIAKRYDENKIIFSFTAVDENARFLEDNKQYDITIDNDLEVVYSNIQVLTDTGIKSESLTGKIEPILSVSYIHVTYEKSCEGIENGVPQHHSYDNRSQCALDGTPKGPQRWTQVFVVSGSGVNTYGHNYNHYSNNDGPGHRR